MVPIYLHFVWYEQMQTESGLATASHLLRQVIATQPA